MNPSTTVESSRRVGVGRSDLPRARDAAAQAVAAAVEADTKLLVVFASSAYDLDELAASVAELAPGVPLIGCSTAGEIATSGPGSSGLVVFALEGDGFSVATGSAEAIDGDLRTAAATAARCLDAVEPREHVALLILSDGLAGDQQEVVRGAYQQVGAAVPLVGGCAGDDLGMVRTHQLHGTRVLTNAVVAAAIASDGPIGIGVQHGWRPVGEEMLVTSSEGTVVRTLDDEPALDRYLEVLDAPPEVRVDPEAFTAFAATRPFGLSRRGRQEVRFVAKADFDARTITCFAEVPQGGLTSIMTGDAASVLEATAGACHEALAALGGQPPRGVMVFDCIARRGVLGEGITEEIDTIARLADGAPVAGFYTYGEIARTEGSSGFHNQTLVVLALG
jgi:hypothetical protein